MPLFLITCLCDEGMSPSSFRVVRATSKLAVAKNMLDNPERWRDFLALTYDAEEGLTQLLELIQQNPILSPEVLLGKIDQTCMDGDSLFQLRIHEIKDVRNID